jgi:hypothetical protein
MRCIIAIRLALVAAIVFASACSSSPLPPSPSEIARRFVAALNAKDTGAMGAVAATPFRFRHQIWETAPDGSGLVLGEAAEQIADNPQKLAPLLRDIAAQVRVADSEPVAEPPSKEELLREPLRGAPPAWSELELVLFRRGEGDVEHIAIVGVNPANGRAMGLYVN